VFDSLNPRHPFPESIILTRDYMNLPKNTEVVGKIIKIVKKYTTQVEKTGNVCIYSAEIKSVTSNDIAIIEVQDKDGTAVGSRTYSGKAFHAALRDREMTTKNGHTINFKVIKCL